MSATVTLVGLAVLVVLVVMFLKLRRQDLLGAIVNKRRGSKLVTRAEYVEGREQIPVVLSLTEDTFYYENPELDASFDLNRIEEVEYSEDLATGRDVHGWRVLRLRSHGQAFEFLMEKADSDKWAAALPARSYGNQPSAKAV
jgi:hypothetical protein